MLHFRVTTNGRACDLTASAVLFVMRGIVLKASQVVKYVVIFDA